MLPDDPEPQPPVQPHGGIRLLHRERDGRIALVGQQPQHRPQQPRPDTPSPAGRIECRRKLRNSLRDTAEPRAAADPDGGGDRSTVRGGGAAPSGIKIASYRKPDSSGNSARIIGLIVASISQRYEFPAGNEKAMRPLRRIAFRPDLRSPVIPLEAMPSRRRRPTSRRWRPRYIRRRRPTG